MWWHQVIFGIFYSSILEWWVHKTPLHKWGGAFRTHVVDHHRLSAKDMTDSDYEGVVFGKNETVFLLSVIFAHLPLLFYFKYVFLTFASYCALYLVLHRVCHANATFAKKWMPWHYVHHCVNARKNFGIIHPIVDMIAGTYKSLT
jgi:hypothetical protein